jgi:GAF domain-containing protein
MQLPTPLRGPVPLGRNLVYLRSGPEPLSGEDALSLTRERLQRRKSATLPSRDALEAALAECKRELAEARRREAASAEILRTISRSGFDLETLLTRLVVLAREICEVDTAAICIRDGDVYRLRANAGLTEAAIEFLEANPARPGRGTFLGRVALGEFMHSPDSRADPDYRDQPLLKLANSRGALGVPVSQNGNVEVLFAVMRIEPKPLTPNQIELVRSFADQAAIAIQNARLFRETDEARERQAATAEILKVIASSSSDAQPVFEAIAARAKTLIGGSSASVYRFVGEMVRLEAFTPTNSQADEELKARFPRPLAGFQPFEQVRDGGTGQYVDTESSDTPSSLRDLGRVRGFRALIHTRLMSHGAPIGIVTVTRTKPGAFAERDVELLRTLADQAAIAINNVGLFNETQEALRQQTATSEVLKVISRSAFDLDSVLDTLIDSAITLCEATRGVIWLKRGEVLRLAAHVNYPPEWVDVAREVAIKPTANADTVSGIAAFTDEVINLEDMPADPRFAGLATHRLGDYRGVLAVPLDRDGESIGVIVLTRPQARRFSDRQVALVKAFADQAVIAIENTRLFEQVQARTRDLEESLQQQKASAEILQVISGSPTDVRPVFDAIVLTAARLFGCQMAVVFRVDGATLSPVTAASPERLLLEHENGPAVPTDPANFPSRVFASKRPLNIPDFSIAELPDHERNVASRLGIGSALYLPLLRGDECIGVFLLTAREVGVFGEKEVALAESFRDQAQIAIENARLFNETQEALQQQTATADVLKVISRSAFDLQAVFDAVVASAVELTAAHSGTICVRDGQTFRYRSFCGPAANPEFKKYLVDHPASPGRASIAGRAVLTGQVQQIPDLREDTEYSVPMDAHGARALLAVPLLGKTGAEGAIILTRLESGPYPQRQIEILQTFADQAVIAIENVRLFEEVQARTKELAASLENLQKTQDRLIQSEKLASLGQLTAGIAHEIKNPLNFINNFSALSRELIDELGEIIARASLETAEREEAVELIGIIGGNLDKVVQHGKRADSIVKNMLMHARQGSGERSPVDINAMVEEALNLAYHGARAERPGFNVTLAKSLDPDAGSADVFPQEISRVLLNLISNAFYATVKRKQAEGNSAYEPTITTSTRDLGGSVEIGVRDNGTGIPDEVRAKIFNPFFTTKPAGEGAGLGLSLSHDIVVKQHGGTLEVATEPGAYTQFSIVLPRAGAGA